MGLSPLLFILLLQAEPSGTPEQKNHWKVTRYLGDPEKSDPAVIAAARKSSIFGARYAALLVQIERAFVLGGNFEDLHRALLSLPAAGAPKGAADHLKALAAGLKEAVYCNSCKDGKTTCGRCQGKKRVDLTCPVCEGAGRIKAPGDAGGGATHKCRNCEGLKVFKNSECPGCHQTGLAACGDCRGRPWRDKCLGKDCNAGVQPCPTCAGSGTALQNCVTCDGKGRVAAPGDVGGGATSRCNTCYTTGKQKRACGTCKKTGRLSCEVCRGTGRGKVEGAISSVYTTDRCDACAGRGWPDPQKAVACAKCCGLGVRVKPAPDPSKLLE